MYCNWLYVIFNCNNCFYFQSPESNSGLPSLTAVVSSREFSHPVVVFPATQAPAPPSSSELLSKFQPLNSQLHCEMHLLNLRAMQRDESDASLQFVPLDTTALLLHHTPFDCSIPSRGPTCSMNKGEVSFQNLFLFNAEVIFCVFPVG